MGDRGCARRRGKDEQVFHGILNLFENLGFCTLYVKYVQTLHKFEFVKFYYFSSNKKNPFIE